MKTELLGKIETLFFENAFAELSMDQIATSLGMKKASLYHHFPSKEAIFLETLEYSYAKYEVFLNEVWKLEDLSEMLKRLINFAYSEKNLYGVVLQRGYCRIDAVRGFISEKIALNQRMFEERFSRGYGLSRERVVLLRSVIDDLSKKFCLLGCPSGADFGKTVEEIIHIFFKA